MADTKEHHVYEYSTIAFESALEVFNVIGGV
jgi:hypothetical protein